MPSAALRTLELDHPSALQELLNNESRTLQILERARFGEVRDRAEEVRHLRCSVVAVRDQGRVQLVEEPPEVLATLVEGLVERSEKEVPLDVDDLELALLPTGDLTVVPVVDGEERPIGFVTVDDVLELLLLSPGRRLGIFGGI